MVLLWFSTARLIMDSKTGRTKGYGFVTFETEAEAQNAIKVFHGKVSLSSILIMLFLLTLGFLV